jgi:hypothetical protein
MSGRCLSGLPHNHIQQQYSDTDGNTDIIPLEKVYIPVNKPE